MFFPKTDLIGISAITNIKQTYEMRETKPNYGKRKSNK